MRLWVLAGPLRMLDPDEAVTGIMAARIAHGSGYLYFAGQRYMGAFEQYLQAPLAALAPGNALVLRLVQVGLSALACALVYRVGRHLFRDGRAAVAAWLFAVGPAFNLVYGVKSRGAYGASVVLGLCALLLALGQRAGRRELATAAGFGFCCGLAGWLSPMAAFLLLPALWWLLAARWRSRARAGLAGAAGALLGAVPLAAGWVRGGPPSGVGTAPEPTSVARRLAGLVDPVLGEFLGLRWRAGATVLAPLVVAGAVALLAAVWAAGVLAHRSSLRRLVLLRPGPHRPGDLLLLAAPLAGALYLAAPATWYTAEPRYLFPAYPLLALGVAAILPPPCGWRAWFAAGIVASLALVAAGTVATAGGDYRGDLRRAVEYLRTTGPRHVYADYQLAFPLDYYSAGAVVAVPYGANTGRFPDLRRRVETADDVGYVVLDGDRADVQRRLTRARAGFRLRQFGRVAVFTELRPVLRPISLGLSH